jgi:hypothetical protein
LGGGRSLTDAWQARTRGSANIHVCWWRRPRSD